MRGFAQGLALIVGAVGSHFLFGFVITPTFMLGCALVIAAIFTYGGTAQTPAELCESLCGASDVSGGAHGAPSSTQADDEEGSAGLLKDSTSTKTHGSNLSPEDDDSEDYASAPR